MTSPAIPITGDTDADLLLQHEPLALVIGMLLGQQVPMERAFKGPATLRERLDGDLSAGRIAAMDTEEFVALCAQTPAIHRFPASMGRRVHELCERVVADHDGDASLIWTGATDAEDLRNRIRSLPGYGEEKTKILIAILAKRLGIRAVGWEKVAAPFSDQHPRSVADVSSPEMLAEVRQWRKAMKAAKKSKQDSPV